jgi:hypothetical protein
VAGDVLSGTNSQGEVDLMIADFLRALRTCENTVIAPAPLQRKA